MTPGTRTSGRPAVFVQQLHRAAAQRGRLDPVYQDLSDHWTLVLQRLYPVWALIGPGLSDPGHIEIHSRTVYLDSEALLGSRAAIAAGQLEPRAILRCFGVALRAWVEGHCVFGAPTCLRTGGAGRTSVRTADARLKVSGPCLSAVLQRFPG